MPRLDRCIRDHGAAARCAALVLLASGAAFISVAPVCAASAAPFKIAQAEPNEPQGIFRGVGTVTAISARTGALTLNHEDIKGLMPAMIMTFRVASPSLSAGLRIGDRIEFQIDAKNYTITSAKLIAPRK